MNAFERLSRTHTFLSAARRNSSRPHTPAPRSTSTYMAVAARRITKRKKNVVPIPQTRTPKETAGERKVGKLPTAHTARRIKSDGKANVPRTVEVSKAVPQRSRLNFFTSIHAAGLKKFEKTSEAQQDGKKPIKQSTKNGPNSHGKVSGARKVEQRSRSKSASKSKRTGKANEPRKVEVKTKAQPERRRTKSIENFPRPSSAGKASKLGKMSINRSSVFKNRRGKPSGTTSKSDSSDASSKKPSQKSRSPSVVGNHNNNNNSAAISPGQTPIPSRDSKLITSNISSITAKSQALSAVASDTNDNTGVPDTDSKGNDNESEVTLEQNLNLTAPLKDRSQESRSLASGERYDSIDISLPPPTIDTLYVPQKQLSSPSEYQNLPADDNNDPSNKNCHVPHLKEVYSDSESSCSENSKGDNNTNLVVSLKEEGQREEECTMSKSNDDIITLSPDIINHGMDMTGANFDMFLHYGGSQDIELEKFP